MDRDGYLGYVRSMHARLSKRASDSGFTSWAMLAALVYVISTSIPLLPVIAIIKGWPATLLIFWAETLVVVVCVVFLALSIQGQGPVSHLDYRVPGVGGPPYTGIRCLLSLFVLAVPAVVSAFAWCVADDLTTSHYRTLTMNAWFFGLMFGAVILMTIHEAVYRAKTGFPNLRGMRRRASKIDNITFTLLTLIFLLILGGNAYFLCETISRLGLNNINVILTLASNLTIATAASWILVGSLSTPRSLESLERLERDIVLHDLTSSQIKDRLQQEFVGLELGEWLKNKLEELRFASEAMRRFSDSVDERLQQLASLDSNLRYERKGRFTEIVSELERNHNHLSSLWRPLEKWMTSTLKSPMQDSYVRELLGRTRDDLALIVEEVQQLTNNDIVKVKAGLDAIT